MFFLIELLKIQKKLSKYSNLLRYFSFIILTFLFLQIEAFSVDVSTSTLLPKSRLTLKLINCLILIKINHLFLVSLFASMLQIILFLIFLRIEVGSFRDLKASLYSHIIKDYKTTLKMVLPPTLLILSTELLKIAYDFLPRETLESSVFNIMSVAVFSTLILRKKFLLTQALAIILITSGLVHFPSVTQPTVAFSSTLFSNLLAKNDFNGYLLIVTAVACYGLSFVLLEQFLKSNAVSLWVRGIQLNLFNVPLSLLITSINYYNDELSRGFFENFTIIAWFFIIFVVACNMMELFVIKVSDSVFRMISLAVATMIIGIMQYPYSMLDNHTNSPVKIGTGFIVAGVVLYCIMDFFNQNEKPETDIEGRDSSHLVPLKLYQSVPTVSYKVKENIES